MHPPKGFGIEGTSFFNGTATFVPTVVSRINASFAMDGGWTGERSDRLNKATTGKNYEHSVTFTNESSMNATNQAKQTSSKLPAFR